MVQQRAVVTALCLIAAATGQWTQRKTAILDGDITIGYLFSMHEQPEQKSAHMRACGRIWEEYGIQRAEATFQTIERINDDPTLLPGIRLGVEIRDDCWYAPVALEQTLEFIRDVVAAPSSSSSAKSLAQPSPPSTNSSGAASAPTSSATSASAGSSKRRKILVGVIGPGSSAVSIQVQNLLQLFHIPQIGYSATSRDLSDKNRFRYFLRVVPPDELQARAMLQIVQKYNWTYVSAVSTEGSYGQSGLQVFREYADREDICIAKEYSILSNDNDEEYDKLLTRILEEPKARVIVCFCEGETVNAILKAIRRFNQTGHFLLVGSDGWADRLDVVQGYEAEAEGGISIRIHSPPVASFDQSYFSLKPDNATLGRNPWFREFWEHRFNCSFAPSSAVTPAMLRHNVSVSKSSSSVRGTRICSGQESLRDRYKQDSKMGFVIKATYAMAWALHYLQQSVCGAGSSGLCTAMLPIDGSLLRDHLMNVSFLYGNETVQFDSNGNPPGWYDIMNYQHKGDGRYNYVQIGSWKNGTLDIPNQPFKMVTSVCSEPCQTGQVKIIQKELSCCWQCVTCEPHQRVLNETTCQDCQWGYWPDSNKNECKEIPPEIGKWSDGECIAAVTLSAVGLLATLVTAAIFACHNNTPVVKASTRELTYLILFGMALCYVTTFPLIAVPSRLSCTLSRILPGLSFSLIFAALLTKTNRIARILAGSKKRIRTQKSRWLSLTAQVLITMTMIGIEGVLIVAMLILEPADAVKYYPSRSRVLIVCNTTTRGLMAPLCFDFFLIGMCTVYAVKTRNLPENFNEAKFIGFAMYTTCVIWVAFVPIYFSGSESKTITLCFCVSLSAVVTLVLLFGPKLYIIVFKPEKNNRSAFTTTADLRIHIAGGTVKYNPTHSNTFSNSGHQYAAGQHLSQRNSSVSQEHHSQTWNPSSAIQSMNNGDKSRANMTFLRRAFGSQLDLTDPSNSSVRKCRNGSYSTAQIRCVEVQTDIQLFSGFLDSQEECVLRSCEGTNSRCSMSSSRSSSRLSEYESPSFSRRRRWASITERRLADEEADIIISLGTDPLSSCVALTDRTSLIQRDGGERSGVRLSQSDYDVKNSASARHNHNNASQVATISASCAESEAYCRLQSLGITVAKGSTADIL